MTRLPVAAVRLLAARWFAGAVLRRAAITLTVAFAVLTAVFMSVCSFEQTPAHTAQQRFGTYDHSTYTSITVGDLQRGDTKRLQAAITSAAPGAHLVIESRTLRPDAYPKFYFQAPTAVVRFLEDPQVRRAFPERYALLKGRWPSKVNDVVVSEHLLEALPSADRSSFTVLSGTTRFHVVGVVRDDDDRQGDVMIAGAGTWEALTPRDAAKQYQPTEGQTSIYWNDGKLTAIVAAADRVLPALPEEQGSRDEIWNANTSSRSELTSARPVTFGSDQVVVSYLPLLMVALLVAALVVATTRRPIVDATDRLVHLGLDRARVRRLHTGLLTITAAASIIVGIALGTFIAVLLRSTVLARFATQPFSPLTGVTPAAWLIIAAALVVVAAGAAWPAGVAPGKTVSAVGRIVGDIHVGLVRRVLIGLCIVAAVLFGATTHAWIVGAHAAIGAAVLLAPDFVRLVVWAIPRRSARLFVARGIMRASLVRQGVAAAVIAACVAVPIGLGTQLASKQANDSAFTFSTVPTGQMWVERASAVGDVDGIARAIANIPGMPAPVTVRALSGPAQASGAAGPAARFLHAASGGTGTLTLDDPADLRRLIGSDLPNEAESVLRAGGVIDFSAARGSQRFVVVANGGERQLTTPVLPTLKAHVAPAFSTQFSGAVLTSTAEKLGLPVSSPVKYLYPSVTTAQIRSAVTASVDAGYDSEFVHYHVPPPAPTLPAAAWVFFTGLALGGFVVLLLVVTDQARRLRDYSERLVAIGLRPGWTRGVLAVQAAVIVGVGLVTGVVGGVLSLRAIAGHYAVTAIPSTPIIATMIVVLLATAAATLIATRSLTARPVGNAT